MAKSKQDQPKEKKPFIILAAKVKEDLCEYSYEINSGPCEGDQVKGRKGANMVHDDLLKSFQALNVHLAILDDAFEGTDLTFEQMKIEAVKFNVNGFKVSGSDDNEGFIIYGSKWVRYGSVEIDTPKISKSNAYPYWDDLCEVMESARNEVLAYMNGRSAPRVEQAKMEFSETGGNDFNNPM